MTVTREQLNKGLAFREAHPDWTWLKIGQAVGVYGETLRHSLRNAKMTQGLPRHRGHGKTEPITVDPGKVIEYYFGKAGQSKVVVGRAFGITTWWVSKILLAAGYYDHVPESIKGKIDNNGAQPKKANDKPVDSTTQDNINLVPRPHDFIQQLRQSVTQYDQLFQYIDSLEQRLKEKSAHNVRLQELMANIQLELTRDR